MWWVLRASFTSCWALPQRRNMSSVARIAIQMCPTCASFCLSALLHASEAVAGPAGPTKAFWLHSWEVHLPDFRVGESKPVWQHGSILKFTFLNYRAFVLYFWLAYRIITYNAVLFPRLMCIQIHVFIICTYIHVFTIYTYMWYA